MRVLLLAQTRAELCGGPTLATLLVHGVAQLLRHHESGDRVISVCQASARRSYINLMCASASSGIPAGLVGKRCNSGAGRLFAAPARSHAHRSWTGRDARGPPLCRPCGSSQVIALAGPTDARVSPSQIGAVGQERPYELVRHHGAKPALRRGIQCAPGVSRVHLVRTCSPGTRPDLPAGT